MDVGPCQPVLQLYGSSTFHIAGRDEEAIYDGIGSGRIFPSKLYHRSRRATRRSVKLAFFFQKAPDNAIDPEDLLQICTCCCIAIPSVSTADPGGSKWINGSAEPPPLFLAAGGRLTINN